MDLRRFFLFGIAFISFFFSFTATAATVIDNNAPIVSLRTTCTEAGGSVFINNCFTDVTTLNNWLRYTRKPNVSAPLLVEIGPGNFGGINFGCLAPVAFSHVTFRGAGMKKTAIGPLTIGLECTELTFQDLTVTQYTPGGNGYAVTIVNTGTGINTTWNGVFLDGNWDEYDSSCDPVINPAINPGKHYWFHSRINGKYNIKCDQSWFFGSEISGQTQNSGRGFYALIALDVASYGEAHIYGSNINAIFDTSIGPLTARRHVAVSASAGGKVHIHGTGIDVIGNGTGNIIALEVGAGGEIHANGAAYHMKQLPGGTKTRIQNNGGVVHAPYVWEEDNKPPTGVSSQNGADMFVQTGCAANGCQNAGTETHLLIYNKNCTGAGGPWFDVVTRACR